jgi:hypothetical protein
VLAGGENFGIGLIWEASVSLPLLAVDGLYSGERNNQIVLNDL